MMFTSETINLKHIMGGFTYNRMRRNRQGWGCLEDRKVRQGRDGQGLVISIISTK